MTVTAALTLHPQEAWQRRSPKGLNGLAIVLTLAMHTVLFIALVLQIDWRRQTHSPAVTVELWRPGVADERQHVDKPTQPAEARPLPPPAAATPPQPSAKSPSKVSESTQPIAANKQPASATVPQPPEKKPSKPTLPNLAEVDHEMRQLTHAEQKRSQAIASALAEANAEIESVARGSAQEKKEVDEYGAKIRQKVYSEMDWSSIPYKGNPEVVLEIDILPTGDVHQPIRIKRSSGYVELDRAAERAVLRASPYAKPPARVRTVEIRLRPK